MIALDHISLSFGSFGIHDLTLAIEPGTYLFIIGPSGAGKTLILETIAGLHSPDSGRVLLRGGDATGILPEKRGMALVYQDYSLFPHLTVTENIAFGLFHQESTPGEHERTVATLISQFRLESIRDRYPKTLSGGEQQRVAIARALATKPEILLLDEPFAALDPLIREQHIREMRRLQREHGLTVIQVSHSRDEAFALADRVAVVIDGRLVQSGTCEEIFFHPATESVGRFVGIENMLHGMIAGLDDGCMVVDVNGQHVRANGNLSVGEPVVLCVRGSDVLLNPPQNIKDDFHTCLAGVVADISRREDRLRVEIDGSIPLIATLPLEKTGEGLRIGQRIRVSIDAAAVHVIRTSARGEVA